MSPARSRHESGSHPTPTLGGGAHTQFDLHTGLSSPAPGIEQPSSEELAWLAELSQQPPEIFIERKTLYRGSSVAGLTEFSRAYETTVGSGVYFVDNPADAAGYAKVRARADNIQTLTVYEAEVSNLKLVNLTNPEKLQEVMAGFIGYMRQLDTSSLPWWSQGGVLELVRRLKEGRGTRPGQVKWGVEGFDGEFTKYLQDLGYDGLATWEGGEDGVVGNHETFLIFDPEHTKVVGEKPVA